jgi:hypothetical protein
LAHSARYLGGTCRFGMLTGSSHDRGRTTETRVRQRTSSRSGPQHRGFQPSFGHGTNKQRCSEWRQLAKRCNEHSCTFHNVFNWIPRGEPSLFSPSIPTIYGGSPTSRRLMGSNGDLRQPALSPPLSMYPHLRGVMT